MGIRVGDSRIGIVQGWKLTGYELLIRVVVVSPQISYGGMSQNIRPKVAFI